MFDVLLCLQVALIQQKHSQEYLYLLVLQYCKTAALAKAFVKVWNKCDMIFQKLVESSLFFPPFVFWYLFGFSLPVRVGQKSSFEKKYWTGPSAETKTCNIWVREGTLRPGSGSISASRISFLPQKLGDVKSNKSTTAVSTGTPVVQHKHNLRDALIPPWACSYDCLSGPNDCTGGMDLRKICR